MKRDKAIIVYEISILLLVLSSMKAYFLWAIPSVLFPMICLLVGFVSGMKIKTEALVCIIPLLLLSLLKMNLTYFLSQLLTFLVVLQLLSIQNFWRKQILGFVVASLSVILIISLFFWLLHLFIYGIPMVSMLNYGEQYFFENHIFFLRLTSITGYYRFVSVFIEPGHLAMFSVFFLYATGFDFKKWYTWALLLSILFSLSLAGYILLVIGYLLHSLNEKKAFVGRIIFFTLLLVSGFFAVVHFGGEENIVYEKIILRMEADEETGIVGNNRTDDYTDALFDNTMRSGERWLGLSLSEAQAKVESGNLYGAGYKIYLIRNGIIGVLACFFFYFYMAYNSTNRKYMMLLLLLFAIAFLQRAYPFWMAWMLPFLCTLEFKDSIKRNRAQII